MNSTWLGLSLALWAPGAIALLAKRFSPRPLSVATDAPWLAAFVLLIGAVAAIALYGEGLSSAAIGFAGTSWWSIPGGLALAMFFIFGFGPAAYWVLARTRLGGFETGEAWLAALPRWYLCLTITVVAGGEEWLYRGYAIERLEALTGDTLIAGVVSLLAFGIVHLPLWGIGVSLTTLVSGGILTALYIWRRDVAMLMLAHVIADLYGLVFVRARSVATQATHRS
jgi:membrane protease YdiL (CAAX protease family)